MPLKAVLFDMDGVIVDTEPLHRKAYFHLFKDLGIEVNDSLYETFTGNSTQKVCQRIIDLFGLDLHWKDLASIKRNYFKHYFDTDSDFGLLEGVDSLVELYRSQGIRMAVASSAHRNTIQWVLDKFNLQDYFESTISGADLKESKPHPEIFLLAAESLEQSTQNCMVIEDSTNGIIAAKRAGIFCAAFKSPNSVGQDYSQADVLVDQLLELTPDRINRLMK